MHEQARFTSCLFYLFFYPPFFSIPIFFHPFSLSHWKSPIDRPRQSPLLRRKKGKRVPHESIKREGREIEYVNCANKHLMESYQLFPQKSPVEEGRRQEKNTTTATSSHISLPVFWAARLEREPFLAPLKKFQNALIPFFPLDKLFIPSRLIKISPKNYWKWNE